MTRYGLDFKKSALEEWNALDRSIQERFKKKLDRRLESPRLAADALSGNLSGCYRLKDSSSGYRLIYKVVDHEIVVLVLAVGKRERRQAYRAAAFRNE